jgi:D-glycero-D-manno-heptose 1,7-bisphosphate phosphatase
MESMPDAPEQAVILFNGLDGEFAKSASFLSRRAGTDLLIETCSRFGFRRILLVVNESESSAQSSVAEIQARLLGRAVITLIPVPAEAGSVAALRRAESHLDDRFLLLDGTLFFDTNWLDLVPSAGRGETLLVMSLRRVEARDEVRSVKETNVRAVTLRDDGMVDLERERSRGEDLADAGVYLVRRGVLPLLHGHESWRNDVLPDLCMRGLVRGRVHQGRFLNYADRKQGSPGFDMRLRRARRAVFFDRDGTLNFDAGYTHRPDDLRLLPGAIAAVKRVNDLGRFAFLVTNQAGIAKGHFTEQDMHAFNAHLQRTLRAAGAHLDDIQYCPDHPEGIVEPYVRRSEFRKPAPGMLLDLMKTWPVVAEGSIVIGDRQSDVEAAQAAGLHGVLYKGGDLDQCLAAALTDCED